MLRCISISFFCFATFINAQNFWEKTSFPSGSQVNSVYCILGLDDNSILVGTYAMGIYRSTDDGQTWASSGLNNQWVLDLAKDSRNNIYALTVGSTYGSGLFKSTDDGVTWNQVWSYSGGFNDLYIDANDNIYIGLNFFDRKGSVYKSSDGGSSWSNIFPLEVNVYAIVKSLDGALILAGYDSGVAKIYRSTNEGASWNVYSFPVNFTATDFAVSKQGTIFLATAGYGIYRSTDNGLTWSLTGQMSGPEISCLLISGANIYAGTRGYWVYVSTDGGNSFSLLNSGMGQDKYVLSLGVSKSGYLFAGMDYYGIYRSVNKVTSLVEGNGFPERFELRQNYPNPFNPVTKIGFSLPRGASVKLVVYDVLGREIEELVNGYLEPGVYEIVWDGFGYPSGVYYYRLWAGEYVGVRKMVLLK